MSRFLPLGIIAIVSPIMMGCQSTTVRGPQNQRITLMQPDKVTIHRGEAKEVTVMVERENLTGPVTVDVSNLPAGVEAVDVPKQMSASDSINIVLRATQEADLVENYAARVSVEGPDDMRASEHLRVTVRE